MSDSENTDRIELIRTIKRRYAYLEPLEMAEIWYRYHRKYKTYKPPQSKNLRRLNGRKKRITLKKDK